MGRYRLTHNMDGRSASLLLLALIVQCVAALPQDSPAQDPWLQILNGAPAGEDNHQLMERQEQEPVQEIQQVQPRRPPPAQPPFQRRPQRPPQRFPNRGHQPQQRPSRPLRPRPGVRRKPPGPGEKGIFDKITGTIVSGYEGIKCSGSNLITD